MSEIIDLEMSDDEYLHLIAQGRDPVSEKLYERQLVKLCRSLEEADQMLSRLDQSKQASEEIPVSTRACERFRNYLVRQPRKARPNLQEEAD